MSVKVTLNGDGLSFDAEATVLQAAQIIGFLGNEAGSVSLNNAAGAASDSPPIILGGQPKPTSPRERLQEVGAKTNAQKILTFGQFIIERDGTTNFSVADVKSMFGRAGEPVPRNLGRDLKDAVRLGYIYDDESISDHYIVTHKGLEMLTAGFAGEVVKLKRKSPASRKRTNGQSAVTTVSDAVKDMDVNDVMDGFPNYRALSQKSDRLMWILAYAQQNGIDKMKPKDIEDVAHRLSDNIPARQVAPFTQTALKKSYVSKTAEGYRILFGGIQYLQVKVSEGQVE